MKRAIPVYLLALAAALAPVQSFTAEAPDYPPEVMALHEDALVADLHADTQLLIKNFGYDIGKRHFAFTEWGPAGILPMFSDVDIPRMRDGGLDLVTLAICPRPTTNRVKGSARAVRHSLDIIERAVKKNSRDVAIALGPDHTREIVADGMIAGLVGLEGGHGIEDSIDNLREFYGRGVRYMTVTHSHNHNFATAAGKEGKADFTGLTDFGREVVQEMERLGMMIDVSHASEDTFWDIIDAVDCPVIATHSGARAIGDHPRNLTDEQIMAIAGRGGVIGVIFHAGYLNPEGDKPVNAGLIVDHMDHIKEIAGVDAIALGSDYDGGVIIPPDLGDAARLPALTVELKARGYTDIEVRKILGENFLATWKKIENHKGTKTQRKEK